ncbi:hypothetical protein QBC33DRAFT_548861 [Phialemonium atrogriseum]|uniref:GPI anchored protein n=1 Tax=Phialemonium atrogriseum TaxID=1093897 RepID=A0AAJ0BX17_9PEZI|nr:uncharacterized protein QBC33DRAFT_548861 [Phialemonium atrogriseum]KAK1763641.1 hypothetical protein QBC33DRAFT_548861 [Phialemonium atrogriseum]
MKSTSIKSSVPVLFTFLQLASSNFIAPWARGPGPLFESLQGRNGVTLGRLSNSAAARGLHVDISSRQEEECIDPGYLPCPNIPDSCCPAGYNCFSEGCCVGTPAGFEPCPDSQWCYRPGLDICCPNGSCLTDYTCCDNQCCKSIAYCGSDGWCSACPPVTRTEVITTISTTLQVVQVTVTKLEEPEEASDFSCIPVTVTNSDNAIWALDADCALSYSPPTTTSTSSEAGADAAVVRNPILRERQFSCTPFATETEFVTLTSISTLKSTVMRTVSTTLSESEFSCPTMAFTNAGGVLSLDASCGLAFSLALPSSSSAIAGSNSPGSSGGGLKLAGGTIQVCAVQGWQVFIVSLVGFLIL